MSIFKYDEIYIEIIEQVCNNILRVTSSIREGKKEREMMLATGFKSVKLIIGNSERHVGFNQALQILDESIYNDEYTLRLLILSFNDIEKKRKESTFTVEKDCGVIFKTDDKPTGIIEYKD